MSHQFKIKQFQIFNRSGQTIFERSNCNIEDPSAGWNGQFNGVAVAPGTYVYNIVVVCDTNEIFSQNGTVVLIR